MVPQARFVSRDYGEGEPFLILGSAIKGNTTIKPGMVYQLDLVLGELVFKEVGKSWMTVGTGGMDVNSLLDIHSKFVYATVDEYNYFIRKGRL